MQAVRAANGEGAAAVDNKADKNGCFSLSKSQMNIWDLEQAYPGTPMNNICETIHIHGRVDYTLLVSVLDAILKQDPCLRIRITLGEDGLPVQYTYPYVQYRVPVFDFASSDDSGLKCFEESVAREVFPLLDSPLYYFAVLRLGEYEGAIFIKTHHLISDGYSAVSIIDRITGMYLALLEGSGQENKLLPSYRRHVDEEEAYIGSEAYKRDQEYWKSVAGKGFGAVSLRDVSDAEVSPVGQRLSFRLSETFGHALDTYCRDHRIAPFAVFYIAMLIYLGRARSSSRVCIGTPVYNRRSPEDKATSGMFVNTLPFCCDFDDKLTFEEMYEQMTDEWLDLLRHQRFPYPAIVKEAKEIDSGLKSLFHIVLSYQNSRVRREGDTSVTFSGAWHYSGYQAEHVCVHLTGGGEEGYLVSYDYLTQLFSKKEITDFHHYLINIISRAMGEPDKPAVKLAVMDEAELEKVVYTFNDTRTHCPCGCINDRLSKSFTLYPERVAVIQDGQRYTYHDLQKRAERVAESLFGMLYSQKKVVAVLLRKGYGLFCALAGIARAGDAWVLLSPEYPRERIRMILADCGASAVITSSESAERFELNWLPVVDIATAFEEPSGSSAEYKGAAADMPCQAAASDTAYLVYTSGSTGTPKGVEISNRSLLNYAEAIRSIYAGGGILSVCGTGFDAFLLESVVSLLNGQTVIAATEAEQEDPSAVAALISGYAGDFLAVTPSRLAQFLKNKDFREAASRLKVIICGGEMFPPGLLQKTAECTNALVYNQYGPSETTIGVTTSLLSGSRTYTAGKPMNNCRCYILDGSGQPLPVGVDGELYIGGICVGKGYHGDPERTAKAFLANPFEHDETMYRTGDMASWTKDGEIIIKGRKDSQVKINGQRVELSEIASRVMEHPAVEQAAVCFEEEAGHHVLVSYYCSTHTVTLMEFTEYLAAYLPYYMIPAVFKRVARIPLTQNGKTDLKALSKETVISDSAEIRGCMGTVRSGTIGEEAADVLKVFRRVLGKPELKSTDDYFLSGGDSLNGMETLSELTELFGIRLRLSVLYACRTAEALAGLYSERGSSSARAPEFLTEKELPEDASFPVTPAQLGIYFETVRHPGSTMYNMPCGFAVNGRIDAAQLEKAIRETISAESVLRTYFAEEGGTVKQRIDAKVDFKLAVAESETQEELFRTFVRSFDLAHAPLFRAALIHGGSEDTVLIDMHHLVGDGITAGLLLKRIEERYRGCEPEGSKASFAGYAAWLKENSGGSIENEREYWKGQMLSFPELPVIPHDLSTEGRTGGRGAVCEFKFDDEFGGSSREYCEKNELSPFMLFAGVFGILLANLCGCEDIAVGTPVSVRRYTSLSDTAGLFVNTLPFVLHPAKEKAVLDYFSEVKNDCIALLEHPDITTEELLSIGSNGNTRGNPLYRAMISMRPFDTSEYVFAGRATRPVPVPSNSSKTDLNIEMAKCGSTWSMRLEYDTELFKEETVQFYGRCFIAAARSAVCGKGISIRDLHLLQSEDEYRLIELPLANCMPFSSMTVDEQILSVAERMPDKPAVIFHNAAVSFRTYKAAVARLSKLLSEAGLRRGDKVGILCGRGPELLAAMTAVMKNGAAYVPMLPGFPQQRLTYMMKTAGVTLILCDEAAMAAAEALQEEAPCTLLKLPALLEEDIYPVENEKTDRELLMWKRENGLCCVLFTSGSTGKPKGVMIRHRAFSNAAAVLRPLLSGAEGTVLCATNSVFDVFATETLFALASGKTVVMADEEEMMMPHQTAKLIKRYNVGTVQLTPTRARFFFDEAVFCNAVCGMPLFLICGEKFERPLLTRLKNAGCNNVYNLYGPTEGTVYVSMDHVTEEDLITIGTIFPNCRGYVLGENKRPVMPSSYGELYIAGECLSAGYIGREDLTAGAFLPDPFFPGELMYKTGDIVRQLPDGRLDYIGRADRQVKLNGQRVELDEITEVLLRSSLVSQAAVIVDDNGRYMNLHAYVSPPENGCIEQTAIRGYLEKALPAFMVPSVITVLDRLPETASGKTDFQSLAKYSIKPAADTMAAAADTMAAAAAVEKSSDRKEGLDSIITEIWSRVLHVEQVDKTRSFFEQGGSSFAVMSVLSEYYSRGYEMTLKDFYAAPTVEKQAELLSRAGDEKQTELLVREETEKKAEAFSEKEAEKQIEKITENGRSVFLTGATGFLGAHLLRELLLSGYGPVYCLVRGDDRERLEKRLTQYFGSSFVNEVRSRIVHVKGDILDENLGGTLKAEEAGSIQYVIHAAADVRHFAADGAPERINREGTAHAAAFAKKCRARFIYISTTSICGSYVLRDPGRTCDFSEDDFDIGQNWRDSVYLRGKFEAECCIREMIRDGLCAAVMRVGRLVGRSSDGVFQVNPAENAFALFVNGLSSIGEVPEELLAFPVELTAVDLCAKAIVMLIDGAESVYHIFNPNMITVKEAAENAGIRLAVCEKDAFFRSLQEKPDIHRGPGLAMLFSQYKQLISEPQRIRPVCEKTAALLAGNGFVWGKPDAKVLLKEMLYTGNEPNVSQER